MPPGLDSLTLVTLSLRLLAAGLLIQTLELLCLWRELPDRRLLGWQPTRGRLFGPNGKLLGLYRHPASLWVLAARAGAAAACLVLPFVSPALPWLLASLVAAQAYYNHRFRPIHQGADTMFLVGLCAVWVAALDPHDPPLRAAALGFLAFQVLLAYVMSGWDKLKSQRWRSGGLLPLIFCDSAHRFAPLGEVFTRRRALAFAANWSIILLELLFPVCLLLPQPGFLAVLAAGAAFHLIVAFTMGLHGFFWSFVSSYPAIYFIYTQLTVNLLRA